MMTRALMASPERNKLYLLGIGLCIVVAMTAYGQIRLNAWNQPFYDALVALPHSLLRPKARLTNNALKSRDKIGPFLQL